VLAFSYNPVSHREGTYHVDMLVGESIAAIMDVIRLA